jgi:hemerythrin
MASITKRKILDGVFFVEIPDAELKLLCGCPADAIKHLAHQGLLPVVEKEGVKFEAGPNAILLSDTLIQKGSLSNLSEFPVLHMFYNQGMILPGHPNNSMTPILVGRKIQVLGQMDYIFIGNYGLVTEEEFLEFGEDIEFAREYLGMKLRFAYGQFIPSSDSIQGLFLEEAPLEIKKGVFIERLKTNVFKISYKEQSVTINLNLKRHHRYKPSYRLPRKRLSNHHFAVIHSGEGDGWDHTRPCLSSIIMYKGKLYLIDAGPNIKYSLKALGLKPDQIDGIFMTHVHDDHFAGLFSLMSSKKKLQLFSSGFVKATIIKKLQAVLFENHLKLSRYFDFHNLQRDEWNHLNGLEIKPIPSAHPIDTTLFLFRAKDKDGYKSYGHYSDIAALDWLKKLRTTPGKEGLSDEYIEKIRSSFQIKVDVKKIDVGGPTIHGDIEDFADDPSERLVIGHTHAPFTERQLQIGTEVSFGTIDVLIDKNPLG